MRTLLLPLSFLLLVGCNQSGPQPAATNAPGLTPAASKSGPRLYVSDETGGMVVVADLTTGQIVEKIPVGKRPRGIRLSTDGTRLLIALSGSPIGGPGVDESKLPPPDRSADGIGILDLATHKVTRTLTSGQDPEVFDLSPDGKTVYVSNEDASEMSVIDIASAAIRTRVPVGE